MSIDSFDWLHRTGANPPNEPFDRPLRQPAGRSPFRYEGIFAHEYQHLLEFWASPGRGHVGQRGPLRLRDHRHGVRLPAAHDRASSRWDGHIQTFLGWRTVVDAVEPDPAADGGAENSLTIWDDQGDLETLADYGAAWTFMEFLHSRYGPAFMTDLHNEDVNGLEGLQALLDRYVTGTTARELIHEWAAMVARRPLDRRRREAARRARARRTTRRRRSTPPSTGRTRRATRRPARRRTARTTSSCATRRAIRSARRRSVARVLGADDHARRRSSGRRRAPGRATRCCRPGAAAEHRPLDRPVDRPCRRARDRSLVFDTKYNIEPDWDFGDRPDLDRRRAHAGRASTNADTTTPHNGGRDRLDRRAAAGLQRRLGGWSTQTFDLSAYAGQTVLLRFR